MSMYNKQKLARKRKLYEISNETEEEENVDNESHENQMYVCMYAF